MERFEVFLSCVNHECDSEVYVEVIKAMNLESAFHTSNILNRNQKDRCDSYNEFLVFKPIQRRN